MAVTMPRCMPLIIVGGGRGTLAEILLVKVRHLAKTEVSPLYTIICILACVTGLSWLDPLWLRDRCCALRLGIDGASARAQAPTFLYSPSSCAILGPVFEDFMSCRVQGIAGERIKGFSALNPLT
ncbi:hypothetical protein BDZ45DRAFT_752717 [Acephala macrosclerotiorum]|nr:hypothetical protein BDZ45DRAFT_752717 [Acephala macrosclerotiorum]